jgi:hypothetical protein
MWGLGQTIRDGNRRTNLARRDNQGLSEGAVGCIATNAIANRKVIDLFTHRVNLTGLDKNWERYWAVMTTQAKHQKQQRNLRIPFPRQMAEVV